MRPGSFLVLALLLLSAQLRGPYLLQEIGSSQDVTWLERLATEPAHAEVEYSRARRIGSPKDARSRAYLRLGDLGTPESLSAVARIEERFRSQSTLPRPVVLGRPRHHPAAHMSDATWRPDARVTAPGGREYGAFVLEFYGARSVFLAWRVGDGSWTRPRHTAIRTGYFLVTLAARDNERIRVELVENPAFKGPPSGIVPKNIDGNIVIAELVRDSDADGWTDLEETELGLNPNSPDSDSDGLRDDRDAAPLFAPRAGVTSEDGEILQRAVFAVFGLTGASHALFAESKAHRLQLQGLPGPVIYSDSDRPVVDRGGGVQVSWRVIDRQADTATVEITDYEGVLAASGEHVTLRRIAGAWYAVARKMLWIS
jgi:hypothetical protein